MPKHIPPARNEAITIMPVASNGFGHSVTIAANGGKTR